MGKKYIYWQRIARQACAGVEGRQPVALLKEKNDFYLIDTEDNVFKKGKRER